MLTTEERQLAEVYLEDAANLWLADYADADEQSLLIVSCNMVIRAMKGNGDAFGIDGQQSSQIGWVPYLEPASMKPTSDEIALLSKCPQTNSYWL
ncbi:MAG: hypothetical protein KBT28_12400 [Bacteroidales bacterium]|nr:hypothetical protein [Candidatus Colimorpha merdihippi]